MMKKKRPRSSGVPNAPAPKKVAVPMEDDEEDGFEFFEDSDDVICAESTDDALRAAQDEPATTTQAWTGQEFEGELEFDPAAYACLQRLKVEFPSLSFDILRDKLGARREKFPLTFYFVTGTSATKSDNFTNKVSIHKVINLHKTNEAGSDLEEENDETDTTGSEQPPVIVSRSWRHPGCVNRIRAMPQKPHIVATWSDRGLVHVWDGSEHLKLLDSAQSFRPAGKEIFQCKKHTTEGFALAWSELSEGRIVTGDCKNKIFVWDPKEGGTWAIGDPHTGHTDSVEDIQWSPSEGTVFVSCSVDKSIRIWDIRDPRRKSVLTIPDAHDADVNVLDWNRLDDHLLASGGDDNVVKVWDLRTLMGQGKSKPCDVKNFHNAPIASVRWHPHESSMIAIAADDNTVSLWDLSWETDNTRNAQGAALPDGFEVPPQLAFLHHGQTLVKEIHWHPQIPSLLASTAQEGFNFFKPINL